MSDSIYCVLQLPGKKDLFIEADLMSPLDRIANVSILKVPAPFPSGLGPSFLVKQFFFNQQYGLLMSDCPFRENAGKLNWVDKGGLMLWFGLVFNCLVLGFFSVDGLRKVQQDGCQGGSLIPRSSTKRSPYRSPLCVLLRVSKHLHALSCWVLSVATRSRQAVQGGEQASPQLQ